NGLLRETKERVTRDGSPSPIIFLPGTNRPGSEGWQANKAWFATFRFRFFLPVRFDVFLRHFFSDPFEGVAADKVGFRVELPDNRGTRDRVIWVIGVIGDQRIVVQPSHAVRRV